MGRTKFTAVPRCRQPLIPRKIICRDKQGRFVYRVVRRDGAYWCRPIDKLGKDVASAILDDISQEVADSYIQCKFEASRMGQLFALLQDLAAKQDADCSE